jgi:hypothetical protein
MENKKYYTELGMLAGIVIGAGIGIVLFASTGNILYIVLAGVGCGIGLSLGAGVDQLQQKQEIKANGATFTTTPEEE